MDEEMEICSNCKREIRSVNYVTHSVHCHRNIVICKKCKEPVPRAELAEHEASEHDLAPCKGCGTQVEKSCMAKHQKEDCSCRIISCSFCELELKYKDLLEHISYCGTRTEKCSECGEFVMIKYQALHLDSNHGFLKLQDEPVSTPGWLNQAAKKTTVTPAKVAEPSRPILKSAIRAPASSAQQMNPVKKSASNTVRFAQIETLPVEKIEKEELMEEQKERKEEQKERQIKFANNKIGAEVKPIVNNTQQVVKETKVEKSPQNLQRESIKVDKEHMNDVEADRLFAFKLAQDEMEMMSKLQLDGILKHRRSVTDLNKKALADEDEKPSEKLLRPQRSVDVVQEKSKSPTPKREIPVPPAEHSAEEPYRVQEVQIPCEFCEVLIPFSRLLIHQTGCRPDLTSYIPFKPKKPTQAAAPELFNTSGGAAAPRNKTQTKNPIPCDLCNAIIPADKFIQHQLACEIKHLPGRSEKPKALVMPLSGRTLKASKSIDETILPALETLEREVDMKYKAPSLRNCKSASDVKSVTGTYNEIKEGMPEDVENKAKQGAVPKQKPKSIKKYRAPQPPQP